MFCRKCCFNFYRHLAYFLFFQHIACKMDHIVVRERKMKEQNDTKKFLLLKLNEIISHAQVEKFILTLN